MPNSFLTDDVITLEALSVLENQLVAAKHTERKFEALYGTHDGSNRGATIRVRKPNQYTIRSGATFSAQDVADDFTSMSVSTQIGVDVALTSAEMAQSLSSFSKQIIVPAVARIANEIDAAVLALYSSTPNVVGTPGSSVSALSTYLSAGVKLDQNAAPRDNQRAMIVGPQMQADIIDALKGLYQSSPKLADQYSGGEMGKNVAGFNWDMDQNVAVHTVGVLGGTPLTNGIPATGATTLVTNGWTAAALARVKVGDVFTIANVYSVNPVSKVSTGVLKQFVATAIGSSDASGNMTLSIYPAINSAATATQNVNAAVASGAALTFVGTASAIGAQGLAWHKSAIALAFCELPKPEGVDMAATKTDKQLGLSIRFVRWYDGSSDQFKARFDVLYGVKALRPEWIVRVAAAAA